MTDPRWLTIARGYEGTREVPGPKTAPRIATWLGKLKAWWKDDETPWCGVFVAACMQEAGLDFPKHYMRAKAWADWGARLQTDRLAPGAILVFDREGGGHVGFYVGESATHYHVLGGNQRNSVNVMALGKGRLVASRWPKNEPVLGKPVRLTGGVVSTNEA